MTNGKKNIIAAVISILIGLLFGLYLLVLTDVKDALPGFAMILSGGFTEGAEGISRVLFNATPIIFCGLSVGLAFKAGHFNIGVPGQFTVGAFAAVFVGVKCTFLPGVLHLTAAILAAALAGALWGAICGALKACFKVNEVISGIMLNYIAMYLVNLLIKNYAYDGNYNGSTGVADTARLGGGPLDWLFPGNNFDIGIFAAVIAAVFVSMLMNRTVFGYELVCCGRNRFSAEYAGVGVRRNIALSLCLAGTFAGLGGAMMYLSPYGTHIFVVETILSQGFTGLSVALLGMFNPYGILVAGLFVAHITVGGSRLQLFCYSSDVVDMIIAVIVYCGALTLPVRIAIDRFLKRREHKKQTPSGCSGKEAEA